MLNFQFYQRVKMLFGCGSVAQVGELVVEAGYKKPFVVCDPGIVATGLIDKVQASLTEAGVAGYIFDEVHPDPPADIAERGAEKCVAQGCDCVIAVGGGGVIDTGKAINMLRFNEGPLLRFKEMGTPMNLSPGLITIPTTSGTGSEVSDGMVISGEGDDHYKYPMLATNAMSDYAILDPEVMAGMPPKLTTITGLDAFSHLAEGMVTNIANDFCDFFCEQGVRTVVEYLPRAIKDGKDMEARSKMAIAATVGGWMLGYAHTHAGHSFGHVLGGLCNVPHGLAVMGAEPYVIEFNAPACPGRTKKLGVMLGAEFDGTETPEEIGAKTRDAMIRFRDVDCNAPSIKDFPYDKAMEDEICARIETELFQVFNPKKMTAEDARVILHKMYE